MRSLIVAVVRNSPAPSGAGLTPVEATGPPVFGAEHAAARSAATPSPTSHLNATGLMRSTSRGHTSTEIAERQNLRIAECLAGSDGCRRDLQDLTFKSNPAILNFC